MNIPPSLPLFPLASTALVCVITAAAPTSALSAAEASEGRLMNDVAYTYSVTPNVDEPSGDPEFVKLHGDRTPKSRIVAWRRVKTLDIDFDLKKTTHLSDIVFESYRPNKGWFFQDVSLYVDEGQGFQLVDTLDTGHRPQLPVNPPYEQFRFKEINRNAIKVRLRIEKSGIFALSKVRIYEKEKEAEAAAPATKAAALPAYSVPATSAQPEAKAFSTQDDTAPKLLLSNRFLSAVIEPAYGGVISALHIPGHRSYTPRKGKGNLNGGLLSDHVSSQNYRGDWADEVYDYEILPTTPEKAAVRVWRKGTSGALGFITFSKTYTLYADQCRLEVKYEVSNAEEALVTLPQPLWFHSFAAVENWQEKGALSWFFPSKGGVVKVSPAEKSRGNDWVNGPVRGWTGVLDEKQQAGLVMSLDYRYLASFYNYWTPAMEMPTLEWRFHEVAIKNGESFSTTVSIQPFSGLGSLSGGSANAAGSLLWERGTLTATVVPSISGQAEAELRMRRLPGTEWTTLATRPVELKAGERVVIGNPALLADAGTYVFSTLIKDRDGKELLDLEEAVTHGASSGVYHLSPKEAQILPEAKDLKLVYTGAEAPSPHIAWATPSAQGKIKAVVFTNDFLNRDIAELAQRVDLDLDTTYIYPNYLRYGLGDYVSKTAEADLLAGLAKLWERTPDWKLLVLPGAALPLIPEADRQKILNLVAEEGRGLVIVNPSNSPEFAAALPVGERGKTVRAALWKRQGEHSITRGIPFASMPATDLFAYPVQNGGEVVASAGEHPLLAIRTHGKGRIATFAWRAEADGDGTNHPAALMPLMYSSNRDVVKGNELTQAHEYQFLLLIRAMQWAADQEPATKLDNASIQQEATTIAISHAGPVLKASLRWAMVDVYGKEIAAGREALALSEGANSAPLPTSLPLARGVLHLWLDDAQGRVIDSGAWPIQLPATQITAVELDRPSLVAGESLGVTVRLSSKPSASAVVDVKLVDGYGREIAAATLPATEQEVAASFKVDAPLSRLLEVHTSLRSPQRLLDQRIETLPVVFPIQPVREREPYFIPWTSLASQHKAIPVYQFDFFLKQLKALGVNGWVINPTEKVNALYTSALRNNLVLTVKQNGMSPAPSPNSTQERPIRATTAAETLKDRIKQCDAFIPPNLPYGAVESLAGDETKFAERGIDMSYDDEHLGNFRQWLQTRYETLAALNAQWETDFSTWNEVLPPTLRELHAKNTRNFSGWADFRAFGDVTFANFYKGLRKHVKSLEPRYQLAMSGTPYTDPYLGYDYRLVASSIDSIQTYSGTDEMVSFADRNVDVRHWGEGHETGGSAVKYDFTYHYFRGGTGMNFWNERLLFHPDFTLSTIGKGYAEHYKPFREGVARLLVDAQLTKDRVAIHYSTNSSRMAYALKEYELWKASREGALKIIENCGFDASLMATDQVEGGSLTGVDLFILPFSSALTPAEAKAITAFVENGGTVIAMGAAGIADGSCKLQKEGLLDALFGITRVEEASIAQGKWEIAEGPLSGLPVKALENGVRAKDATVIASTTQGLPVAFQAARGKGRALYFSCDFAPALATLNKTRTMGKNEALTTALESFLLKQLAAKGITPRVRITTEEGQRAPFVRVSRFIKDGIEYYGVLRDHPIASSLMVPPVKATIQLPAKGFIRDLLNGRDYGFTDTVNTVLLTDSTYLFAVVPEKVESVAIAATEATLTLGDATTLRFSVSPGKHTYILKVDVYNPKGERVEAYSSTIVAREGKAEVALPSALNDLPGAWKVEATDLASGVSGSAALTLKSRPASDAPLAKNP